jgi:hypothetical protein
MDEVLEARRAQLIDAALERRRFSPAMKPRIEALLDGREDRERLRCCNSGCFVCVQELRAILTEVEAALQSE